jgi:hypothetical protein
MLQLRFQPLISSIFLEEHVFSCHIVPVPPTEASGPLPPSKGSTALCTPEFEGTSVAHREIGIVSGDSTFPG